MSNITTDSTDGNTSYPFLLTTLDINSTRADNTTTGSLNCSVLEKIAANDIASRANYVYSCFAALGFFAGSFLLYNFFQAYRGHKQIAWLDCLLRVFCGLQLLLLLLSLHIVAYRPNYFRSTALGCAALSFTINTVSLCSMSILVLIAYVLTFEPPSNTLLRKPGVCTALVIVTSTLISLLLAGIRGPRDSLQTVTECIMDPAPAGVSYAAARLWMAFLIPYLLQIGLLITGCIKQWKSKGRFLSGSEEGPVFLAVTVVMLLCLLFYSVVLLRGAKIFEDGGLSHYERAFLSVSECVLFSGSSISLLLVLLMHRPCRESLHRVMKQLRDCFQRRGSVQPNRNIITPQIEFTETLQDIES